MTEYHEPWEKLPEAVRDVHRALTSFKEEIEAIDWYHQRAAMCDDEELRAVIEHNRDEEIEHATMTLEWLRRHMPHWNEQLERYLFTTGPIALDDEAASPDGEKIDPGGLRIGAVKEEQ